MKKKVEEAVGYIRNIIGDFNADVALVLGSGLGDFADMVEKKICIPYSQIPHFPVSSILGHKGQLTFGTLNGKNIVVMEGRVHYYEGYPMNEVVFPIYVLHALLVKSIILTNAVGAINEKYEINDFVLVNDHINFTGYNPLIGHHYSYIGLQFPSLTELYSKRLNNLIKSAGESEKVTMHDGVFVQFSGPSFETPAEIRFMAKAGADIVGMSSAIEAISARHCGMEVCLLSHVTNFASGVNQSDCNHEEVLQAGKIATKKLVKILTNVILRM